MLSRLLFFFGCIFLSGFTLLLCWDINTRLTLQESLDRMNAVTNINNANAMSDVSTAVAERGNDHGNYLTRSGAKCLTFEESFDNLVASSSTILITMPAKAAGSSIKKFIQRCGAGGLPLGSNQLNSNEKKEKVFSAALEPPKIIASHINADQSFVSLFKNTPRRTLILYVHRNEHDRLISAIKYVVVTGSCDKHIDVENFKMTVDGPKCVLDEDTLLNQIIKPKLREMRIGPANILTCDMYRSMEDNFPRLAFVHYKKVDEVMRVLAKNYCPQMLGRIEEVRENIADEKDIQAFVTLETGEEIKLDDWLEAKRDLLEFTFDLREEMTCQGKTRSMEDDLLGCKDEILQITRDTAF